MDYLCGQRGTVLVDECVCVCVCVCVYVCMCAPVMSRESTTETVAVKCV